MNGQLPGALILGGHFLSLGAARNLAQAGVRVGVADCEPCVARFSRCVRGFYRCPPPADTGSLVAFLRYLARERGLEGWVLFPSTDEFVRLLAQNHAQLEACFRLTTPPWDVIRSLYDKRLTYRLASDLGVPIPDTVMASDLDELVAQDLAFPVVLKPAITSHLIAVTKKKAYRADDRQELVHIYRTMAGLMDPAEIIVQELIPGRTQNLYSFGGLFREGVPVAGFSARRLRQHPMEFGRASTFVQTVDLPELEALATRLLRGIGYSGLAEVEFMYDPKHGRFELLEVNPRIWGWHSIALRAGVNLPYLAYAQALGIPAPVGTFREGVKWVRMLTDIPTVAGEIWRGQMTLAEYVRSMSGEKEFAVLSWRDPLPSLMELLLLPYYARKRGF